MPGNLADCQEIFRQGESLELTPRHTNKRILRQILPLKICGQRRERAPSAEEGDLRAGVRRRDTITRTACAFYTFIIVSRRCAGQVLETQTSASRAYCDPRQIYSSVCVWVTTCPLRRTQGAIWYYLRQEKILLANATQRCGDIGCSVCSVRTT